MNYIGSKRKIFKELSAYFPKHDVYIEPFLGGGSVFLLKDLAKYNILNDINDEVFDYFTIIKSKKYELLKEIDELIVHESLFKYYKNKERTRFENAMYFILKNTLTYLGAGDTLKITNWDIQSIKEKIKEEISIFYEKLQNAIILNKDFREFLKNITIRNKNDYKRIFIYCDPPYLESTNKYTENWKHTDLIELLNILKDYQKKGTNFIVSEHENEKIIDIAKDYNLNVYEIKKVNSMNKKINKEIILTNLNKVNKLF
jgi:DNA adenine methylase